MLLYLVSMFINAVATILMAMTVTIIGRSLAFGMGVALLFFPADTVGGMQLFGILAQTTHNMTWAQATAYLLGPTLNGMPLAFLTGEQMHTPVRTLGDAPLVFYDGAHAVLVALVYMAAFAVISLTLMRQRDIHE
jgi:hypothetical protein